MQVTNVINDLSGLNDSPAMKNRQFRIPTYVSIVEGCLTNLYRFIALIINQTTTKDYASTYKLNPLCEILNKNGFDKLTESVNINIRNAINHGGIVFEEDGQKIVFHYTENKRSVSSAFKQSAITGGWLPPRRRPAIGLTILPSSHSPSVISGISTVKPSQAMGAVAREPREGEIPVEPTAIGRLMTSQ